MNERCGLGVDAARLAERLQCPACHATVGVEDEARATCAFLYQRLGRDPLRLRYQLAVRAVGRTEGWRCARCRGEHGHEFRADDELCLSAEQQQRLAQWFACPRV